MHNPCYDEGTLRAYQDHELSPDTQAAVRAHLSGCATCQTRMNELRAQSEWLGAILVEPVVPPEPRLALQRFQRLHVQEARLQESQESQEDGQEGQQRADSGATPEHAEPRGHPGSHTPTAHGVAQGRTTMNRVRSIWSGRYRALIGSIAAVVVMVSLLALPPVRAMADQLLQVFRMDEVMFVPVDSERMAQLDDLELDGMTLFAEEPTVTNEPAAPLTVATVDEASDAVGYSVLKPTAFSTEPISSEIRVRQEHSVQFQINIEAARKILELLDITDVTLPDALGEEPVKVDVPASAIIRYHGENYDLTLVQGDTPDVTLPEGVALSQPGYAMLRVLGMEPDQAEALSSEIDWSSTLLFPFPADVGSIRQVTVGNTEGLLTDGSGMHRGPHGERSQSNRNLYWHSDGKFYVLIAEGRINSAELIALAESVQ